MFVETCHACSWSKDGLNIYHCIYFYIGLYLLTQIIHIEKSISIQGVMGYILDTHTHSWSAAARQQDSLQHYIRYNYTRPGEDRQPIRFQLACQPKTNCVLALTEVFYLHNSNPKAKQPAPGYITDLFTSTKHTTPQPHWNRHMLDPYTCTRHNFTHKSTRNGIHTQQCDRPRACCKQLQWPCVGDIKHTALITHHQTP